MMTVNLGDQHTTTTSMPNAQTTSTAHSFQRVERPPLANNNSRPLANESPSQSLGGAASPYVPIHSRPLDTSTSYNSGPSASTNNTSSMSQHLNHVRPLDQSGAMSHGRMALDQESRAAFDRLKYGNTTNYRNSSPSPGQVGAMALNTSNNGGGRRRGMIVDVPASQHVNRSIAPNPSAMWKMWEAPDGETYFSHEPTGTMQRLNKETGIPETIVTGVDELTPEDLAARPRISNQDTVVDINAHVVSNLNEYGATPASMRDRSGINQVASSDVYRNDVVPTPRGQFSPTRKAPVEALAAPRISNQGYQGRRLHRVTLMPGEDRETAVVEHRVESLQGKDLVWDRSIGKITSSDPERKALIGNATIFRQWEHVRKILMQGRYFKKHSATTNIESYRFVFLTADNSYVASVPTSDVMMNINEDPVRFGSVTDTIQYYSPDAKAFPVNAITHVSLGSEEDFVSRKKNLLPENTFVMVFRKQSINLKHALVLECQTAKEAKLFCDSWNFFLYYSRPMALNEKTTPQIAAPVTFGTRTGVGF